MFYLMFDDYTFISVWVAELLLLGNSRPLGRQYVPLVFCLFVIFIISYFGFKSGIWLLIALVPEHCFSSNFITLCVKRFVDIVKTAMSVIL